MSKKLSNRFVVQKICEGVSYITGKRCEAKAVNENTLRRGTREFLDPRYCQMHQETVKRCECPKCVYHIKRRGIKDESKAVAPSEIDDIEEQIDENEFGKNKLKTNGSSSKIK